MSLYDYQESRALSSNYSFYSLLMAAMRQADTFNLVKLRAEFPEVWAELQARYNAPGGLLADEESAHAVNCPVCRSAQFSGGR